MLNPFPAESKVIQDLLGEFDVLTRDFVPMPKVAFPQVSADDRDPVGAVVKGLDDVLDINATRALDADQADHIGVLPTGGTRQICR